MASVLVLQDPSDDSHIRLSRVRSSLHHWLGHATSRFLRLQEVVAVARVGSTQPEQRVAVQEVAVQDQNTYFDFRFSCSAQLQQINSTSQLQQEAQAVPHKLQTHSMAQQVLPEVKLASQ